MQSLLHTEPLSIQYWLTFTALGAIILIVLETYKWVYPSQRVDRQNQPCRTHEWNRKVLTCS